MCKTYRKVTAFVMTLVVNKVGNSASPATRNREQLVREERVAQRFVEEGSRGRGSHPLYQRSVKDLFQKLIYMIDLLSRGSGDETLPQSFLAAHPSVSVSHDIEIEWSWVRLVDLRPCKGKYNEGKCR